MHLGTRSSRIFCLDLARLAVAAAVVVAGAAASAQVRLLGDLVPGPAASAAVGFTALGDRVYFQTSDSDGVGFEVDLWAYDPVSGGVGVVATISETASGARITRDPEVFTALGGRLYFFTLSPTTVVLWAYDPATGQARTVAEYDAQPQDVVVESAVALGGSLYVLTGYWDEDNERRFLAFDPATETTATLAEGLEVSGVVELGGRLYLSAEPTPDSSYPDLGEQLWALDPGTDEIARVELVPGQPYTVSPGVPVVVGDHVVIYGCTGTSAADCGFLRYDPAAGMGALVISDDALTAALGEYRYIEGVGFDDSRVYFVSENPSGDAQVLFALDVASGAVTRVTAGSLDVVVVDNQSGAGIELFEVGGRLVFTGDTEATGEELWALDPATGETTLLADLVAGPDGSRPGGLTVVGDALYFLADSEAAGREPHVYAPAPTAAALAPDQTGLSLSAPVPNPGASVVRLELTLDRGQRVEAAAFDVLGRRVAVLHDGVAPAGRLPLVLDASGLPTGAYVVRVRGEAGAVSRTVTVAR